MLPVDRNRTTHLHVREDLGCAEDSRVEIALIVLEWHLVCFMLEHKLLNLSMIRSISIMVNSTSFVPGASHDPPPSSDQQELKAIFGALVVYVALDQRYEPV